MTGEPDDEDDGGDVDGQNERGAGDDPTFTHVGEGDVEMVDVTDKPDVERIASASGRIALEPSTVAAIRERDVAKGDVLATARVAASQAVKRTWDDVPLCHQIPITGVDVDLSVVDDGVAARVEVRSTGKTGVEMEALNGATRALLTVWDMVKSAEKDADGEYPETAIGEVTVDAKVKREP